MTTPKRPSPLPLFNLLLGGAALAVAVAAHTTDEVSSRPPEPVVAPLDAATSPAEVRGAVAKYADANGLTGLSPESLHPITTDPVAIDAKDHPQYNPADNARAANRVAIDAKDHPQYNPQNSGGALTPAGDCRILDIVVRC